MAKNETELDEAFKPRPLRMAKRNEAPQNDAFVCRPMRLGSATTGSRKLVHEEQPHTPSSGSKHLAEMTSVNSSPRHENKGASILIKNLPIVHSPKKPQSNSNLEDMIFALCVVDFHHVRGPEIQYWRSNYFETALADLFKNLPFQAMPDGSHLFEETFSNFNLVYDFENNISLDDLNDLRQYQLNPNNLETLFGCSCVRQIKTSDMSQEELSRNKEITRSMVQKAVVVISRKQPIFTKIKEKLAIITQAFFQQDTLANFEVLDNLFVNLNDLFRLEESDNGIGPKFQNTEEKQDEFFVNLNLRTLLATYKNDFLVILKALLLEKKIMIYSNNNLELLTQFQNNLIALIPDLLNNLELSGCPLSDYAERYSPLTKPTSLKTNERESMLRFFGLPLQIFNTKGLFWNPYLPLQQLEALSETSYMVGCSNLLIANLAPKYKVDLLVNLDTNTVSYPVGKDDALSLSVLDKKFIASLLALRHSEDEYLGSDDHIRNQFEDYIRGLLASTRYHQYFERFKIPPPGFDAQDKNLGNLRNFGEEFIHSWLDTRNFAVWNTLCDEFIFNFHDPVHIATHLPEHSTNFSDFLLGFKRPAVLLPSLPFTNAQKPQKFIPEKNAEEVQGEIAQKAEKLEKPEKAWPWFKK